MNGLHHSPAGSTGWVWAGGGRWSVDPLLPPGRNATQSDQSLLLVVSTLQTLQCLIHPARLAVWGRQSLQGKRRKKHYYWMSCCFCYKQNRTTECCLGIYCQFLTVTGQFNTRFLARYKKLYILGLLLGRDANYRYFVLTLSEWSADNLILDNYLFTKKIKMPLKASWSPRWCPETVCFVQQTLKIFNLLWLSIFWHVSQSLWLVTP